MNSTRGRRWFIATVFAAVGICCLYPVAAQDQGGSKGIESTEVIERPAKPPTASSTPVTKPRRRVTYRSSRPFSKKPPPAGTEYAKLGLTIWRLQGPEGVKHMEQEGEEGKLEQVEASRELSIGSAVRIGIESLGHDGFLYVIDREQFADGTYGAPLLIFPTKKTRAGNNQVRAHQLILIPRPPSYFRINQSSTGKKQTAEMLTMILSPTPLELPAALGDKAITLSNALFKSWESRWATPVNTLEMEGGAGQTVSVKAQLEGSKSLDQEGAEPEQLTDDDPLPQTVYRSAIKRGAPLLVTVPLRFQTAAAPGPKTHP